MNAPLRRLGVLVLLLFLSLLAITSWTSVLNAKSLAEDGRNNRVFLDQVGRERAPITVGEKAEKIVAQSKPADDSYRFQRSYPDAELYAHTTGYFPVVMAPTGIEATESKNLTGTSDQFFYRRFSDLLTGRTPKGATVELTLNPAAQQAAWDALGDQKGAVVAIEPRTGNILAMVSKPSFDPNLMATHDTKAANEAFRQLNADPNKPLLNRATERTYPPGSVFKVLVSALALESGRYQPETQLPGPAELAMPQTNRTLKNSHKGACGGGDPTSLLDALKVSCNTAYGHLGMEFGSTAIRDQAAKFGFGADLRTPLRVAPSEVPVKDSEGNPLTNNKPAQAYIGIGQFDVRVTPLQVALMSATVANDGSVMQPQLLRAVRAEDRTIVSKPSPTEIGRAMSRENSKKLTDMMVSVVQSPGGTGKNARIDGITVAGKTGTAQHKEGEAPHAWFTAFAPVGDPKVAVAVIVESGGEAGDEASGGRTAAPIARKVIEAVIGR